MWRREKLRGLVVVELGIQREEADVGAARAADVREMEPHGLGIEVLHHGKVVDVENDVADVSGSCLHGCPFPRHRAA